MGEQKSFTERQIKPIGGLTAVAIGVVAILAVAIVAIIVDSPTAATVAGSTFAAIGSIVGAYFGVKIGSDQSRAAAEGEREEGARSKVLAAHIPNLDAKGILAEAENAVQKVRHG